MKTVKQVEFKIFGSDNRTFERTRIRAAKGTSLSARQIENLKADLLAGLNEKFPMVKFYVVPVGRNQFNVLHAVGNA